jgi:hypothetical protein
MRGDLCVRGLRINSLALGAIDRARMNYSRRREERRKDSKKMKTAPVQDKEAALKDNNTIIFSETLFNAVFYGW